MSETVNPIHELVWISNTDPIPDTCCTCGLFTYDRVTVKHVEKITRTTQEAGCGGVILHLIIHVALGPIGWLIAAMMNDESEKEKVVKLKSRVKIAQCQLCKGQQPVEVVESRQGVVFAFQVHPRFRSRLEEEREREGQES